MKNKSNEIRTSKWSKRVCARASLFIEAWMKTRLTNDKCVFALAERHKLHFAKNMI